MIECLYEPFKQWAEKGSLYIISDTHFDDSDCKLMDKDWIGPQEQVDIINKYANKNDTLIILGDVGNIDWVRKLKAGHKVLIMGNHDSGATNYKRKIVDSAVITCLAEFDENIKRKMTDCFHEKYPFHSIVYLTEPHRVGGGKQCLAWCSSNNNLFDEVYEGPLVISEKIILSHEPIDLPYMVNIHGHDHAGKFRDGKNLNVAANVCGYTPINLKDEIKNGLISKIPTIHRVTIDNATKNPLHKKR